MGHVGGGVGGPCRGGVGVCHAGLGWGWVGHIGVRLGGSYRVLRGCV